MRRRGVPLGGEVRVTLWLAELLPAQQRRCRGADRGPVAGHGADRGPVRAVRLASRPLVRRRGLPGAHRPALVHQLNLAHAGTRRQRGSRCRGRLSHPASRLAATRVSGTRARPSHEAAMRLRMRLVPATSERAGARLRHLIPPRVADAMIAVAVAVLGLASGLGARAQHEHMPLAAIPILTAMGLVLYPRRRHPAAVLGAVAAGVVALIALGATLGGSFLAVLCACYSAAVYGSRRLVIGLITGAVAAVALIGIPQSFGFGHGVLRSIPVPTILAAAGAALFGLLIKNQFSTRNAQLAVMAERAEWASAQREQEARRATLAERLRIARELHDIIAHHVSVI